MNNSLTDEQREVVDDIYKLNEQIKEESSKDNPDEMKICKLLNQQLVRGLDLQMFGYLQ